MAEKPINPSLLKVFLQAVKSKLKTVAFTGSYTDLLNKPNIPTVPQSLKNPFALTVKQNGANAKTYDGSAATEVDITSSGIGALPITGGTLTGDLKLQGDENYGRRIRFGDDDYVYLLENPDDYLIIHAENGINLTTNTSGSGKDVTINGQKIPLTARKTATKVVGTTKSGHTVVDCDYLCDGTADQTEIQSAISSLPASGGKIILLEGTYNLSNYININKPNVMIEGMGMGATTLNYTGSYYVMISMTKQFCALTQLTVKESSANGAVGVYINGSEAKHCTVSDVELIVPKSFAVNVTQRDADLYAHIKSVYVHDGMVGIHINSRRCIVEGCYATNFTDTCINVEGSYNKICNNYAINGTGQAGDYTSSQHTIYIHSTGTYNDISGNYILGKTYTNEGGTTNTFTNNKYS